MEQPIESPQNTSVKTNQSNVKTRNMLLVIAILSILLYAGRNLFIPLSFSVLIAFVLYPVCRWLETKGMKSVFAIGLAMLLLVVIFSSIISLLVWQISSLSSDWPMLQQKISETLTNLSEYLYSHFNITIADQEIWWKKLTSDSSSQVLPFIQTTLGSVSVFLVFLVLIPIMSALMLFQRSQLFEVLHHFTPKIPIATLKDVLHDTVTTYYNFIKGMLLVYFTVGILNSIGLLIIGVPHAFLFGFIAAILTFIPYVGIIIGAIPPMLVSWVTFDSMWYPVSVVLVFTVVQYLEANVIFPWAVSSKLNINTLATIIAIIAGGIIWGSAGMILFVPFLGILKVLADKTQGLEYLRLMLGTKEIHQSKKATKQD